MGLLVNGEWKNQWYDTQKTGGDFKREDAQLRRWITADGADGFKAESGRYHLYISYACPWAHRTLIFRALKDLEPHIGLSIVSPNMLENGWTFDTDTGSTGDPVNHAEFLYQVYLKNNPHYSGRVTVPVLWDKAKSCIVNNESAEIIRMMNSAFNEITGNNDDYYPAALQTEIDEINAFVYRSINNGVYRCGFATQQSPYEKAYQRLFDALDTIEARLSNQPYLVGDTLTEADWRLFTTLIRFDSVYYSHFKCNRQMIEDFTHLPRYLRRLYQHPKVADTVNMEHIKKHYYISQITINPTQIVPVGPDIHYNNQLF